MTRAFVPAVPTSAPTPSSPGKRPPKKALTWLATQLAHRTRGETRTAHPEAVAESVARHQPALSYEQAAESMQALTDDLTGLGPLAYWTRIPETTDILVDAQGRVWTDGAGGLHATDTVLEPDTVHALAVRLLIQSGRRLDEGLPFADAHIAGARVHAVLPPISSAPQLSIRLPSPRPPTLEQLCEFWPDREHWLIVLQHLIVTEANLLISGATGSGKTTLLAGMLQQITGDQRIITVEDTRELQVDHPHLVSLQSRESNAEGGGEITLSDLIRQALRMRPDRLIVGECRGAEIADFLAAMNTGHRGAIGTLHANSVQDVPARLHAMGTLAGLNAEAVQVQARSAVDAIIHLGRGPDGRRRPIELGVVAPAEHPDDPLHILTALRTEAQGVLEGPGLQLLEAA